MTTTPPSNQFTNNEWTFPGLTPASSPPQSNVFQPVEDSELFFGGFDPPEFAPTLPSQPPQTTNQPTAAQPQHHSFGYQPKTRVTRLPSTLVWGTRFARATMDDAIDFVDTVVQTRIPEYIITANLNYLMLVEENPELLEVNEKCCCILADGNPIVWRSRLEENPLPCRVAGSDMIIELARLSAEKGYRIFFLGGAPGVAEAAANQLQQWYPQMQIAGTYSPPFRQLSPEEHDSMLQRIREAHTDILLVAFGQPKGELWIYDNLLQLGVPLSIQLGASFDFLAGTATRAPELWQQFGCEWLYRAFSDPKRLLPRYGNNILFLLGCLVVDLKPLSLKLWDRSKNLWAKTVGLKLVRLIRRN